MSMVLLIDGYNVIAPVAAPARGGVPHWLELERRQLIERLAKHLPKHIAARTCVVFDAKQSPKDQPAEFRHSGITVRFAVDYPEADDLLEELIRRHSTPKGLTVVSSDHRVQAAARRRRAGCFDADVWFDDLLDGHLHLIRFPKPFAVASDDSGLDSGTADPQKLPFPVSSPDETDLAGGDFSEPSDLNDEIEDLESLLEDDELKQWMKRYDPDP